MKNFWHLGIDYEYNALNKVYKFNLSLFPKRLIPYFIFLCGMNFDDKIFLGKY